MFKRPVPDTYASKSAPSRFDLILLLQLSSLRSSTTVKRLQFERKSETLRREWSEMPPWILCNENGKLLDPSRVRKVFQRALNGAGLPLHFHPHCLRHTSASLMLQQGESPVYVQQQLGNSSIKLTVDTYGKWLPMGNKQAVDKLDSGIGTKMVAETGSGTPDPLEVPDLIGGPSRTRTLDPLIKSEIDQPSTGTQDDASR